MGGGAAFLFSASSPSPANGFVNQNDKDTVLLIIP